MVEVNPEFTNESLYETIDNLEEEFKNSETKLVISVEPDTIDRSVGTVLFKKGEM